MVCRRQTTRRRRRVRPRAETLLLVFRRGVLRVDVVQPIDYEHVPVIPRERFRLVPLYRVRAHGNVVRAQRFAARPGYAQVLARAGHVRATHAAVGRLLAGRRRATARLVQIELALRQPLQRLVRDQQTPLDVILSHLWTRARACALYIG